MRFRIFLVAISALLLRADVRDCVCDLQDAQISATRGCSLCVEAGKHPSGEPVFLVHDNDPAKPNRWLAVPRGKYDGANFLAQMSEAERLALWNTAIGKGRELWGDGWGIAMNDDIARRQCHAHIHIGKVIAPESENAFYVDGPATLPVVKDGSGFWFHPVGTRLHVHTGEQNNEQFLLK